MTNVFIDIVLPKELKCDQAFQNIYFVTSTHTRKRSPADWQKKFKKYCRRGHFNSELFSTKLLKGLKIFSFYNLSFSLPFLVVKENPSSVTINRYDSPNSILVYFLTRLLCPKAKIYFYSEMWIYPQNLLYKISWPVISYLATHADKHYVIGSQQKKFLIKKNVSPTKIIVTRDVPYAPILKTSNLVAPLKEKLDHKKTIELLYIGRIIPYKGLFYLLKEYKKLTELSPNKFHLSIVGGGKNHNESQFSGADPDYEQKCRQYASLNLASSAYDFYGYQEKVAPYYKKADLLITPNIIVLQNIVPAEAWGRIVPEALKNHVPVLATTAIPSAHDYIKNDINGWIVKKINFQPFIKLIQDV